MMNIEEYFKEFNRLTKYTEEISDSILRITDLFSAASERGNKIIIAGNGGSAAMASHVSADLSKNAKVRSINFNEADLITCLANDRGYENWISEALKIYADPEDVVVLISSSGRSPNIINAANWCKNSDKNITLVTVTGMSNKNPVKEANKSGVNLWVDSDSYNLIEMTHHFWLLAVVDNIIGTPTYKA